jgi:hypothetical protein
MPTPIIVCVIIGIALAFGWPWVPGSSDNSRVFITCTIFVGGMYALAMASIFAKGVWGYSLLVPWLVFLFGYPIFYFPMVHGRQGCNNCQ